MTSDEEYLDNLLKGVAEQEASAKEIPQKNMQSEKKSASDISTDDLAAMVDQIEDYEIEETPQPEEAVEAEETQSAEEPEEQEEQEQEEQEVEELQLTEKPEETEAKVDPENMDITELLDSLGEEDDDLAEISGLLKKADNNEVVDEDMMSLLKAQEDAIASKDGEAAFDIFAEEGDTEEAAALQDAAGRGNGKKKKEKKNKENKDEKPGFLARFFAMLIDAEEDEVPENPDDNAAILEEMEEEDREKAERAKKKEEKKKKKNKKNDENTSAGDTTEEDAEKSDQKKKNKKEKKPRKKKGPVEKAPEEPAKKISSKKILMTAVFCISLVAAIVAVSTFGPSYSNMKNARTAYMNSDYETVYQLLYGEKLNTSDELIYNKSNTILRMQRRLDSYRNYTTMNMRVEALNQLIMAVGQTEIREDAVTYGVEQEVQSIYQLILDTLSAQYGISEEQAKKIFAYDSVTYTQKLQSMVYGTEFIEPGNEEPGSEEPAKPQDILPEEEELLNL